MSRDKSKLLNLAPRRPGQKAPPNEEQMQRLEAELEARGNGVAGQAIERPDARTSKPRASASAGRGVVERVGRLRADGSRSGARTLRRMTIYLPPELARELEVHTLQCDDTVSNVIADAVRVYLDRKR